MKAPMTVQIDVPIAFAIRAYDASIFTAEDAFDRWGDVYRQGYAKACIESCGTFRRAVEADCASHYQTFPAERRNYSGQRGAMMDPLPYGSGEWCRPVGFIGYAVMPHPAPMPPREQVTVPDHALELVADRLNLSLDERATFRTLRMAATDAVWAMRYALAELHPDDSSHMMLTKHAANLERAVTDAYNVVDPPTTVTT